MSASIVAHTAIGSAAGLAITSSAIDTTGATHLVFGIVDYAPPAATVPSDSALNSWTLRATYTAASTTRVRIFEAVAPTTSASHTFTGTPGSASQTYSAIFVCAASGVLTVSPFDAQNGATNAASASNTPGSVTPAGAGELFVAVLGIDGAYSSLAIGSGFTILDQVAYSGAAHLGGAMAYLVNAGSGALAPAWSWAGSTDNASALAAFAPSASAGAPLFLPEALGLSSMTGLH